jgi:hypothetical protein
MFRFALIILFAVLAVRSVQSQTAPPAAPTAPRDPATTIDAATYEKVVRENLDLRRQLTRVTEEGNDLRKKNAALVVQVQELDQRQEMLAALLAESRTPDDLKNEAARLRQDKAALLAEVGRLKQELDRAVTAHEAGVPAAPTLAPAPGSDLYRKLEKENAELRGRLAQARETTQSESVAKDTLSQKQADLKQRVDQLAGETDKLRKDLAQAQARERKERQALLAVARKAEAYQAEIKRLKQEAATAAASGQGATAAPSRATVPFTRPDWSAVEPQNQSGQITNVATLLDWAQKRVRAGQYREAEKAYRQALAMSPDNAQVRYNLGVLYGDYLKRPREAAAQYRKYLALNPAAPDRDQVRAWIIELDLKAGR